MDRGKKDGVSARWFSNGIKMYERNYKEGRWHGTVTRWWPNGQKMYVRAYTNGTRHGKEATWRSDGSPIKLSEKPFISPIKETGIKQTKDDDSESTDTTTDGSSSPNVFEPAPFTSDALPGSVPAIAPSNAEEPPSTLEAIPFPEASTDDTDQNDFPPSEISSPSEFPALPVVVMNPAFLSYLLTVDSSSDEFPPLPSNEDSLPSIPGSDPATEFPPLPESPAGDGGLPPLPGLPEEGVSDELPPLLNPPPVMQDYPRYQGCQKREQVVNFHHYLNHLLVIRDYHLCRVFLILRTMDYHPAWIPGR